MTYQLVPPPAGSPEVGEVLQALLQAYQDNELTGLAFVASQRRSRFITDCVGTCSTNPTLTRGALGELTDKVATLQHDRHHAGDSR